MAPRQILSAVQENYFSHSPQARFWTHYVSPEMKNTTQTNIEIFQDLHFSENNTSDVIRIHEVPILH